MTYKSLRDKDSPMNIPLVRQVVETARAASVDAYLVGGFLRDLLWKGDRKVNVNDLDFAIVKGSGAGVGGTGVGGTGVGGTGGGGTGGSGAGGSVAGVGETCASETCAGETVGGETGSALAFARRIATDLNGHYVVLDESFDTARVVFDDGTYVDFAGCVGGSIETDLKRRDFTINALAFDCAKPNCVLDLVGGVEDIERGLIRAISRDVLTDDPLRLLRAFRFRATLGAEIEAQTFEWIKELASSIESVAAERINAEMFVLFTAERSGQILHEMGKTGLLESIYPELRATRKVTPNDYHHLNLFDHSVEAVSKLEENLHRLPKWAVEGATNEQLSYGVSRLAAAKLATLLHDIGKPDTWEINDDGRHCFYNHDNLGAEMSEVMAERMKWSNPVGRFITKLIKWHLRPGALYHQGPPTPRAINRFYRKMGDDMPELIALALGDLGATCGEGLPEASRVELADKLIDLLNGYKLFVDETAATPKFLNGADVMHLLDIGPGPQVGEILEALDEAQGIKEVVDRQSAERFVIEYARKK